MDFYTTLLWNMLICNLSFWMSWAGVHMYSLHENTFLNNWMVYTNQAERLTILREEIIFNQHRASVFQ